VFHYEYVSTEDEKRHAHRYKLTAGDGVPENHHEKARIPARLTQTIEAGARIGSLR
jgi:hypothetical protein